MGVAALILTGSYNDQEFVRVGYYQNTEHELAAASEGGGDAVPPAGPVAVEKLVRDITKKPRVTRFQIKWCVFFSLHSLPLTLLLRLTGTCHPHPAHQHQPP